MSAAAARPRGAEFRYTAYDLSAAGELTCRYALDGEEFVERYELADGDGAGDFDTPAARAAARLVWLLAGVSYYKTGAPPRVVVAGGASERERGFLRELLVNGLAEFAWTNGVDLSDVVVEAEPREVAPEAADTVAGRPLVPFGGGIDSIVVVDETRSRHADVALFVASTSDVPFEPIEATAALTRLPVLRARRHLDPKVLESRLRGYLNGHVPVTGVLSAVAVLQAVAHRRDAVVMSNEHSASEPTALEANGVAVNHQWSKGLAFEEAFRDLLAATVTGVDYHSALRPYSELWVAERFARLTDFHPVFRSCNKAFYVDAEQRHAQWCGVCDKCCFIDLVLAPYLDKARLEEIFDGREPLADPELEPRFRSLLGEVGRDKPLECVGDEAECRRAALVAAARPDRDDTPLLQSLASYVVGTGLPVPNEAELLSPRGRHFLPSDALG